MVSVPGLSCTACAVFRDQGLNLCPCTGRRDHQGVLARGFNLHYVIKEMVAYILQLTVLFPVLEDFVSLSMGLIAMLWFHLCLGSCGGDIYTLTGPELRNVSEVNAFQRSVGWLHSPPGKKWISESEMHEHILPKTGATLITSGGEPQALGRRG